VKQKRTNLSRAEQLAMATAQHVAIIDFMKRTDICSEVRKMLMDSREGIVFDKMCSCERPVTGKDLEGAIEVPSSRSVVAKRLSEFLQKLSSGFDVFRRERVIITVPRKIGRAQVGYYFACLDAVSGEYLDSVWRQL